MYNGLCVLLNSTNFDAYRCICPDGYTGERCQIVVNPCSVTTCYNGANCVIQNSTSAVCICRPGFAGIYCEQDIPECLSQPCFNGGQCSEPAPAAIKCTCPSGKSSFLFLN